MKAKRLHILNNLPTPYNDGFFKALHEDDDVISYVHHLHRVSSRRPWKVEMAQGYPNRYVKTFLGIDWCSLKVAWKDKSSLFLVGDWAHVPSIAIFIARIIRGTPVALWADTPQEHLHRPWWKRLPRQLFLKILLQNLDVIFATGAPSRRGLTEMGAPARKIVDLQFAVDLDHPANARSSETFLVSATELRASVGCSKRGIVFGMSGTIDFFKKAQHLGLRAFSQALEKSGIALGLLIAGTGDELDKLKAMAEELGITDSVSFLGWQDPEQMDAFYESIDVLLHPAIFDPFPLVVIESLCWGKPVIGTKTSGSVEQKVIDGVSGYVIAPDSIEEIVDAILKVSVAGEDWLEPARKQARLTAEEWPYSRLVSIVRTQLGNLVK